MTIKYNEPTENSKNQTDKSTNTKESFTRRPPHKPPRKDTNSNTQ